MSSNYSEKKSDITAQTLKIESPAFFDNEDIPAKYTCDGDNINPPLVISNIPALSKSLALVMDDPDASVGTWDHWIVFNMPAKETTIIEGSEPLGVPGMNSWGEKGYGGPCPAIGSHRYYFKVYAADKMLELNTNCDKKSLMNALSGHILGEASLMGRYKKQ